MANYFSIDALRKRKEAFNDIENKLYALLNDGDFANLPDNDEAANDLAVQIDRVRMFADQYFQEASVDLANAERERYGIELLAIQANWVRESRNGVL